MGIFGKKKQDEEMAVIVTTKKELNAAIKKKEPRIEVQGDLVKQIKWMKKLSPVKTAALLAFLATAVIPNPAAPISALVSVPTLAAITGKDIAIIILAGGLSVSVIISILKGYNLELVNGDTSILLTKK